MKPLKKDIIYKKSKAALAGALIIFMVSFLVFCICATDVGNVVTSRYKAQKITETITLYAASYIASLDESERNTSSLDDIKERFENLYSNKEITGVYRFKISDIEINNDDSDAPKIKLTTTTSIPTLFLRYVGFGIINIIQTSYAKASQVQIPEIDSDDKSYTFRSEKIITDKRGDDLKITYNGDYLAFAGLNDRDNIYWIDIGSMSNNEDKKHFTISNTDSSYDTWCISKDSTFDLTNDPDKTIGLIRYIKIIKVDSCTSKTVEGAGVLEESTDAENTDTGNKNEGAQPENEDTEESTTEPVVTILNSVKIISRKEFLN